MFSHIMVGSDDLDRSKVFYDAILGALGAKPGFKDKFGRVIYSHRGALMMLTKPINGEPASSANGGTIGYAMESAAQCDAWHAAGVANGGTTCEDPPGIRQGSAGPLYLAYLRDPDGNKLCGVFRVPG